MEDFVYRVKIEDVLQWDIGNTKLSWELIDEAMANAPEYIRDGESGCEIEIVNDEFVVVCPAD